MTETKKVVKININNLSVISLDSGKTLLGVMDEENLKVINALDITARVESGHGHGVADVTNLRTYLLQRNLGDLNDKKLSSVSGYDVEKLNAEQEADWTHIRGLFVMAQKKAAGFNENNCFERLFAKK